MMRGFVVAVIVGLIQAVSGNIVAQTSNPVYGIPFVQAEIPAIHLSVDSAEWSGLLADSNLFENTYIPADFEWSAAGTVDSIVGSGVRLRGNTSRLADKKSYKLDFDRFGGEEFFGLDKFNLKGAHNDPSLLRERLSYYLARQLDLPAPRVNHVSLTVNDAFQGVYVNVEQIDKAFLRSRFGNDTGNLYKCNWGASLRPTDDAYDNGVYELKSNELENDRSDLQALITALQGSPGPTMKARLDTTINMPGLLKFLAVEVLCGHWDGYTVNKNNYYLYHNDSTGLFEFMLYDPDNTFGIDWLGEDWATRDLYDFSSDSELRPAYDRVFAHDAYRNQFTGYIHELLEGTFHPDQLFPIIDEWKALLAPLIAADSLYSLDYGFDSTDFMQSCSVAWGGHVDYGLKPFVSARWGAADMQLDLEGLAALGGVDPQSVQGWADVITGQGSIAVVLSQELDRAEVVVYDLAGRQILQHSLRNRAENLSLKTGLYVTVVTSKLGEMTKKVWVY